MKTKTLQIFVISAIILSSLGFASIESSFAYEWTKSLAAALHIDLAFRDISDTTPTEDFILSLDKDNYAPGDTVVVKVTDTIPNVELDGVDFATAKIDGSSLTLTETGSDTDMFVGSFTLGKTFPVVEYSRIFSFDSLNVTSSSDTSIEDTLAQLARSSVDLDISNPGDVKVTDYVFDEINSLPGTLCFSPYIHAIDVQLLDGATIGASSSEVTLSYANADLDVDDDGVDDIDQTLLQMYYQHEGDGTWQKISPTILEDVGVLGNSDPATWATDFNALTITSNTDGLEAISNSFTGQITFGKFTIGSDTGCSGGGGGGLVRPSLVVNALAGLGSFGGGGGGSAPMTNLSTLILQPNVDIPEEIEQMVLNHDSTVPVPAMDPGLYEDFYFPLIINDAGFVLGGYETTIVTHTLKTDTPNTVTFTLYEDQTVQHVSIYMNLNGANTEIHQSDAQILYNDGQPHQVIDSNGIFGDVSVTVNEIDENRKQVVFEIVFAKPMETSDLIMRTWDQNLSSVDTIIRDAIMVVPETEVASPFSNIEEPEVLELQSQTIPIWIKSNAAWWSEEQLEDSDFVAGIEYLIENKIINVPGIEVGASSVSTEIPEWVKNNAGWWSESLITDEDFIEAMQWLVSTDVIQI